ncbi:hypothetical protein GCM10025868_18050 [Angustibacter aerolatus]|uniref:STAS domain-containing protein n=1 Tax=Angustibacter aerolatus TaxID=1162965 RepID=A0ABQ6JH49_9ACTN|nr:STAS domain-containing protein [Angustibacter aerolatus]GMA86555.1 hypothetical protein GCM10025868_18050 [Angustibacter aerolatus]
MVVLDDHLVGGGLPRLRSSLGAAMSGGRSVLVVDVSGVERLSSTVVGALLWTRRACAARQVRVVLRGARREHLDLLQRTGLQSVLELEPAVRA